MRTDIILVEPVTADIKILTHEAEEDATLTEVLNQKEHHEEDLCLKLDTYSTCSIDETAGGDKIFGQLYQFAEDIFEKNTDWNTNAM